jgi:RNA polymerase sigma-70 factor (ECF subfamily)
VKDAQSAIEAHRGRLLGLAYRMLGSVADAEDVLQDAYLRYAGADRGAVRSAEAFLVTTVTRLCLDRLKSARVKRETYVGPWLPEPVLDADALSPETAVELADDLSFALMLTLERLKPAERAAFLLHDVFETPFSEIAEMLGKSEAACRQLAARARKAVRENRPVAPTSDDRHQQLLAEFMKASASGDVSALSALLTEDAVLYSDGGGVKLAALKPITGADKVARFFARVIPKAVRRGLKAESVLATINGAPGFVTYLDGALEQTFSIDIRNDRISAIYVVRNPEKLRAVWALSAHR